VIATEAVLPDPVAPRAVARASDASWPKTVATLVALELLGPVSLAVVAGSVMLGGAKELLGSRRPRALASPRKTVLISGGKIHAAGHRVVLIESESYWLTAHRFSRAVDRFYTVPRPESPGYADALLRIVKREGVDVYVPVCSPVASLYDSLAVPQLSRYCEVIHVGPESIRDLDDKYAFAQVATSLGLRVPKSVLVTDPRDVLDFDFASERRPFILKSIAYDSIRRLDLTQLPRPTFAETEAFVRSLPISPENPWVMQEFIAGAEYCTHGTLRAGELRVHCCCRSSASQLNYENEDKPEIERWVRRFGRALGLTGQASIDFIEADDDGQIYAIECNPRTHSAITMYYDHPDLAAAYLGGTLANAPLAPLPSSRPTYWLGLWRRTVERLRVIARGKDAVLDWRDPLPFLMLYHWHVPMLLLRDLRERRGWLRIDFNIGKLVQLGGD
jgi:predicted ATP-grasp superfamily ATP-dependent carboligase